MYTFVFRTRITQGLGRQAVTEVFSFFLSKSPDILWGLIQDPKAAGLASLPSG